MALACAAAVLGILFQPPGPQEKKAVNLRCGSYCLYVSLRGLGVPVQSFEEVERVLGQPGPAGYSMLELEEAAQRLGAHTLAVETTLEDLRTRRRPFAGIVLLRGNHFVNLYDADKDEAYIIDPPMQYILPVDTFRALWNGKALLIAAAPLDARQPARTPIWLISCAIAGGCLIAAFGIWKSRRGRRSVVAACWLLAFATLPGCGKQEGPPTGPAVIRVRPEYQDLGEFPAGSTTPVPVRFDISNLGADPLHITKIVSSCACLDVSLSHSVLVSGQTGSLQASVRLDSQPRDGSASLELVTNDPIRPHIRLRLTWKTVAPIEIRPWPVDLGSLRPGDTASASVDLQARSRFVQDGLRVTKATSNHNDLICSLEEIQAGGGDSRTERASNLLGRLHVEVTAGQQGGNRSGTITLELTGSPLTTFTVPVTWRCKPTVVAQPARLFLGMLSSGDKVTRRVLINRSDASDLIVEEVACEGLGLEATTGDSSSTDNVISVTLTVPDAPGLYRGQLTVRVADAPAPAIEVPVLAVIRSGRSPEPQ